MVRSSYLTLLLVVFWGAVLLLLRYFISRYLTKREKRYRQCFSNVLNYVSLGMICADARGVITFVNAAAEEFLGIKRDQALGKHYQEIKHRKVILEHQHSLFSLMGDTLGRGISYDGVELAAVISGHPGTMKCSTFLLKAEGNKTAGVLLTFSDFTLSKLLEEQVQKNECLITVGQMAAGVAHEIRNPLQSVKGFAQLLQEKNRDNDEICTYTGIVISEIERVNTIIREFLQLARPAGIKFEKKDLNSLVRDVVLLVNSEAILRNVAIEEEYGMKMPLITLDASQIKQVLINLFSNALAAIPREGMIKVKTCYDFHFNEARIVISDTGVGMDRDTLEQIGQPFFTTKEEGTGLGLSVSFRIIRDHGGRIEVESTVGKGTTFTIILPGLAGMGPCLGKETCN
ncbi:two-component system sensor histidine kinase NtrB [Candidatus Formimonas warabiya]|uniref:histidine kinase n=1 Tax=Formimonas warabiya TaxID=1761012 RepID=A0A3G1KT34_FORW1|nr:PAS domain-containing sensor histidine kinase [Candidatus Formimonas warabiya]ATW25564.1 hypothetical protein DCMF_13070 [Candidatus Formimonas warabiya]